MSTVPSAGQAIDCERGRPGEQVRRWSEAAAAVVPGVGRLGGRADRASWSGSGVGARRHGRPEVRRGRSRSRTRAACSVDAAVGRRRSAPGRRRRSRAGRPRSDAARSRSRKATALSGAADPSTRIEAVIIGSSPMATLVPATASSWRVEQSAVGGVGRQGVGVDAAPSSSAGRSAARRRDRDRPDAGVTAAWRVSPACRAACRRHPGPRPVPPLRRSGEQRTPGEGGRQRPAEPRHRHERTLGM